MIGQTTHQLSKNWDTLIRWLFETKIYLTSSVVAACSTPLEGSNRAYQHFLSSCFIGRILLITLLLIISLYCKSAVRHFINHQVWDNRRKKKIAIVDMAADKKGVGVIFVTTSFLFLFNHRIIPIPVMEMVTTFFYSKRGAYLIFVNFGTQSHYLGL